jgi:lysophospholipase L1-like esterase
MLRTTPGMTVLFQGDSITDCGRDRGTDDLGSGYVHLIEQTLRRQEADSGIRILNRGVSGNRVRDLRARWKADCLDLKPDLLSILVGINDTWRRFDRNDPTTVESFYEDYDAILSATRASLDIPIVICEPFLLPVSEDRAAWRNDLDPKIHVVRELARRYADAYVPLDGAFAATAVHTDMKSLAGDGVHPTPRGHHLIAQTFCSSVFGSA